MTEEDASTSPGAVPNPNSLSSIVRSSDYRSGDLVRSFYLAAVPGKVTLPREYWPNWGDLCPSKGVSTMASSAVGAHPAMSSSSCPVVSPLLGTSSMA